MRWRSHHATGRAAGKRSGRVAVAPGPERTHNVCALIELGAGCAAAVRERASPLAVAAHADLPRPDRSRKKIGVGFAALVLNPQMVFIKAVAWVHDRVACQPVCLVSAIRCVQPPSSSVGVGWDKARDQRKSSTSELPRALCAVRLRTPGTNTWAHIQLKRGFRLFPSLYVVCGAALRGASAGPPIAVVPRHFEVLGRL
eukprot:CAMPEP_0182527068 /NCGR_PEP_ID=MMETSP1323-20130603/3618_1 /TAXON_ID=236787 /ORGANISM="Florenciella parvula, Strain RCC1693" /LENGTH=198 /DNA_ID=CAMNT_0024736021 /DNA_START=195 /DNA_END=792 /DNA_ORIENTATION=+